MNFIKKIVCLFLFSLVTATLYADYNSFGIPDSSEIRKTLGREWFEAPISVVRELPSKIYRNAVGINFQVRSEEQDDTIIVIVAPETEGNINVRDGKGSRRIQEGVYNSESAGSWVLMRDKKSEKPPVIRYYFARDNNVYVQFRPNATSGSKNSTFADLIIFDSYAARAVPLGVPFNKFYTASFAEIQALTKKTIPWNYVVPAWEPKQKNNPSRIYDGTLVMIQTIRDNLKDIVYEEDAIYDGEGNPVSLTKGLPREIKKENKKKITLCSQGFAKWIVDGIVMPLSGGYLKREPLLEETVDITPTGYQAQVASKFNIYSALDWTRNLAAAALSVSSRRKVLYENSGVDVTVEPFAAMVTDKGVLNTAGYIKNSGYKILYMKQLLYVLAATNPEYFYLVAIRRTDPKSKIETKVFNDCAAIFPYFDASGAFNAVVFYDGVEYTLEDFGKLFSRSSQDDVFVHLTRVKTTEKYYPQTVKDLHND